ncbi:hypothetical protein NARC_100047 [Candidatus Nitrosocosmicus arcticus]|uniref:Uncharacterized protein n=1 Tax=Candidatus Nitrosocosmicus arcticus TaxID=2035267 RepID=A0A557STS4_9ARCH|nr:hypothetical protein NARC_100047 [Candidatus Nitrosocosmicus arcticus]
MYLVFIPHFVVPIALHYAIAIFMESKNSGQVKLRYFSSCYFSRINLF